MDKKNFTYNRESCKLYNPINISLKTTIYSANSLARTLYIDIRCDKSNLCTTFNIVLSRMLATVFYNYAKFRIS